MSAPLALAQRLLLAKYLTDRLKLLRDNELVPQASAEMPSGSRLPVMFGGRLAGWASMPAGSKTTRVADEGALMDWARREHPDRIGSMESVAMSPAVLDLVRQHMPEAIRTEEVLDGMWVGDMLSGLQKKGYVVTAEGEKLTSVPGIVTGISTPAPRVNLAEDADSVIAAAWLGGDIPAGEFLALPAAEGEAAA